VPRPQKPRWIGFDPPNIMFIPRAVPFPVGAQTLLTVDELEALRLADVKGMSQEGAAAKMNVSRATFGRIVAQARKKVADALIHGKSIGIQGGAVRYHPPYGRGGWAHGRGRGRGGGQGPWQ